VGWKGGPFSEGTAGLGSKFEYIVQLEPVLQCEVAGEARKEDRDWTGQKQSRGGG